MTELRQLRIRMCRHPLLQVEGVQSIDADQQHMSSLLIAIREHRGCSAGRHRYQTKRERAQLSACEQSRLWLSHQHTTKPRR